MLERHGDGWDDHERGRKLEAEWLEIARREAELRRKSKDVIRKRAAEKR